jgi:hypothetical protein
MARAAHSEPERCAPLASCKHHRRRSCDLVRCYSQTSCPRTTWNDVGSVLLLALCHAPAAVAHALTPQSSAEVPACVGCIAMLAKVGQKTVA